MPSSLLSIPISAILTAGLIPVFILLYKKFHIYDIRNPRKIHLRAIPTMAGLPMVIAFVIACLMGIADEITNANAVILVALVLSSLLGLYDDMTEIGAKRKLFAQLAIGLLIILLGNVSIQSWYGLLPEIPMSPILGGALAVFFIAIVANMYNLIDGLDGLAGTIGLVITGFFGLWFISIESNFYAIAFTAAFGSIIGFMYFNWQPAKIFMGDTGALWLGVLIAIGSIAFMNTNYVENGDNVGFSGSIGTVLAVLFVPVFDTVRVVIIRLIKGKGIFEADQNHTHYTLIKSGLSHRQVSLFLGAVNLVMIGLAYLLRELPDKYLIPIFILLGLQLHLVIEFWSIKKDLQNKGVDAPGFRDIIKSSKKSS